MSLSTEVIPTVKQELERKTIDVLTTLVSKMESGRLDSGAMSMIGKEIWNITSGLVSDDISEMVCHVAMSANEKPLTRIFLKSPVILKIRWYADKAGYVVLGYDTNTQAQRMVRTMNTEIGLREPELAKFFESLTKAGYIEIS